MADVATRYDAFLVDSYGVLHDGAEPYPGAIECLRHLRGAGCKLIILTNTPRRAATVAAEVARVGVTPDTYDSVVSAGELTHRMLARERHNLGLAPGARCFHFGPPRSRELLLGLDFGEVDDVRDAEFLLITGIPPALEDPGSWDSVLIEARSRALPAICANPDRTAIRAGMRGACAGEVAARYAALGGTVHNFGKPFPSIYAFALEALPGFDARRVAAVGDALATDIRGANDAGLDSIFVAGGLHAEELRGHMGRPDADRSGIAGEMVRDSALERLFRTWSVTPTVSVGRFVWRDEPQPFQGGAR